MCIRNGPLSNFSWKTQINGNRLQVKSVVISLFGENHWQIIISRSGHCKTKTYSFAALKNLGSKAETLFEKKKKEVEELAEQKKAAATELFNEQLRKTGELVSQSVSQAQAVAVNTAEEAKHEAIDAFDAEVAKVEKTVDDTVSQVMFVI